MIKLIAMCDINFGIVKGDTLFFRCGRDLQNFKKLTIHSTVIMGNNTWHSLNCRPLPDRINIILSKKGHDLGFFLHDNGTFNNCNLVNQCVFFINSLDSAILFAKKYQKIAQKFFQLSDQFNAQNNCNDSIWIIGGVQVYNAALQTQKICEAIITFVDYDFNCEKRLEISVNESFYKCDNCKILQKITLFQRQYFKNYEILNLFQHQQKDVYIVRFFN